MAYTGQHEFGKYVGTGRVSGSIMKICNVHASDVATITDHTMGTFKSSANVSAAPNIVTSVSTADISLSAADDSNGCIEGPFIAANISAGAVVVYFNSFTDANDGNNIKNDLI
tara:strand:+ start:310 stop:648 length:339 start_codon:yes stop_codon:yes gene_type:complete